LSADFGREIGEGCEVVARERGGQRELPPGQLHAVAAVARETDHDGFSRRMRGGFLVGEEMGGGGHDRYIRTELSSLRAPMGERLKRWMTNVCFRPKAAISSAGEV
jgi:hypothetical protein